MVIIMQITINFKIGDDDFEQMRPIPILGTNTEIGLFPINDEITLEYNDSITLIFTPFDQSNAGEYVRDRAVVNIIDNDCKQSALI